jgi:PAS domain S-box-containing protein
MFEVQADNNGSMKMNFSPIEHNSMLAAIVHAQEGYIVDRSPELIFEDMLRSFLELSGSQFGFIGQVVRHNQNMFSLKSQASNLPFKDDAESYFASLGADTSCSEDEFRNLLELAVSKAEPVTANATAENPESLRCLSFSAEVSSFMAIPVSSNQHIFGVVCLLNRPGGFALDWVDFLQPLSQAYLRLSLTLKSDRLLFRMQKESLKQQELKFRSLFQLSPDAIIIASLNEFQDCNRAAQYMFGLESSTELAQLQLSDLSPDEQPDGRSIEETIRAVRRKLREQTIAKVDWMFRRRSGELFHGELAVAQVQSLHGAGLFQLVIRDQSQIKQHERELKQHGKQRQEILDSSPVGIVIVKFETGDVLFANQQAHDVLEIKQGQLVSMANLQFWVDERDGQYFRDSLLNSGKVQREVGLVTLLGKELTCMLTWQWNPGTCDEVLIWLVDVTYTRAVESNLALQQSLQKIILDQLPVALFVKDISDDFRYSLCNQMFSELFSTEAPEWIGKTDFDFYTREEAEQIRQQDLQVISSNGPIVRTEEYVGKPGYENVLISIRKTWLPDESGKPLLLLGIIEDITERREAERALRTSERRFRELAEHAPVGIFLTDVNGACLFVNRPWQRMTGLDQEQAAGDGWQHAVCKEDLSMVLAAWNELVLGHCPFEMEFRFITPQGEVIWVSGSAVPFRNESGQTLGFLAAATDITQSKLVAVELATSRDEAHRANQAKSVFLSRMSHELRTPLNAILGFGQLLQLSDETLTSNQAEGVSRILNAGGLLLNLIEDVLDFSRIETGHISLKLRVTDVEKSFDNSVALVQSLADSANVRIKKIPSELTRVVADPRRLQQVLLNLLTNAVKYNRPGGWVELSSQQCHMNRVCLQVRDNGVGIQPSDQLRIWEPFERLQNTDTSTEGTGIGLSISKRLAEMMGGSIGFTSEPGKGSMFWIELPGSVPGSGFSNQLGREELQRLSTLKDMRIAYIEEDLANLKFMSEVICCLENCKLETASNGVDGVSLVRASRPDLVLMDLNLPGLDGWQALQLLKDDARTQSIPVVALSAIALVASRERALQAGFCDFLTKPLILKQLLEAMFAIKSRVRTD